jgi:predicted aminopeptidase
MTAGLRLALACLVLLSSGCANIGYYMQSVSGLVDIWWRELPID